MLYMAAIEYRLRLLETILNCFLLMRYENDSSVVFSLYKASDKSLLKHNKNNHSRRLSNMKILFLLSLYRLVKN